jgi:hypothetical protein
MSSGFIVRVVVLGSFAALTACGGGGGGGNAPAPAADTTAPDTTIGAAPNALTNQSNPAFVFTSTESGTFEGSLDGVAFTTVPNPLVLANVADGTHTFRVRARDSAGNVDATPATHTWTIDTVAPVATITGGPPAETTSTSATITFTTEAGTTVQAFTPTGGPITVTSPLQLSGLTDGMKTVTLRALDAAGNLQLVAAEYAWRVDTTAPTAQIVFPTPVSYTDEADVAVRATVTDAGTITAVSINGVAATHLAGNSYTARVPVSPGDNTLTVSTTDSLGNTSTNATASIANRGAVIYDMRAMVWDAAGNRALVADMERHAVIALRGTDGRASIVSDDDHGTGPSFGSFAIALDEDDNRVLSLQGSTVLAINIGNGATAGDRTTAVSSPETAETAFVRQLTCRAPCPRLYAAALPSGAAGSEATLFTVDLTTGARTVFSGGDFGVGTGTTLAQPTGLVLDDSNGPLRALVVDAARDALFAVDLTTGDRTVISSASVGGGAPFEAPSGLALDVAGNRVFVGDNRSDGTSRVFSVNLANGERTILVASPSSESFKSIFDLQYDAMNDRVLVPRIRPASVVQVPVGAPAFNRFSDSSIGTGATFVAGGSLALDTRTLTPSLLATTLGRVVRVNALTGDRVDVVATTLVPTTTRFTARHLQLDLRGAPLGDRLIMGSYSSTLGIYEFNANGVFSQVSFTPLPFNTSLPEFPYDASSNRMILGYTQGGGTHVIQSMDVATGVLGTPIAESPPGAPTFGALRALALDTVAGTRRILAVDTAGVAHAFDLANGSRTTIASSLGSVDAMTLNVNARLALLVSGSNHALTALDLATGSHTEWSGPTVGRGPQIMPIWPRIAADFDRQIAYVLSNEDTLLTIDLVTGERVITSR